MRPAETRVECPHADRCSGCPRIDLVYADQLERKRERVALEVRRYPELASVAVREVRGADPIVGYRTRAKLVVAPGPRIGLYAKGGAHDVVDLPGCRVLAPALARVAAGIRELLAAPPLEAGSALVASGDSGGALRAVDLRETVDGGEPAVLVHLVLDAEAEPAADALAAAARAVGALPDVAGVAASTAPRASPRLLGGAPRTLVGPDLVRDRIRAEAPYTLVGHGAFAQVHRGQAARVHAAVRDALGEGRARRVLELFAGSGALGLSLAAAGERVVVVDAFAPALAGAERAAREQGIAGVEVLAGDAAEIAAKLAAAGERFDAIVVNPPRRGLAPSLRAALSALAPGLLAYVSCEPTTLGRDLAHLRRLGLAADAVEPFDMIPLSDEVECLSILRPAPRPAPRVLFEDQDVIAVDKDPFEPTTPQGEHATSLLARVRRLPGAAEAVPVHRLDAGTSGACLFARRADLAADWARALADPSARKEYTAGVRGIAREKGVVSRPLLERGRAFPARTRYRRLRTAGGHSLLRVEPEQGRTHQIRRHLAAIGHPLLGDARHGHAATNRHLFERHGLDRPFLHCARLDLAHPRTGARIVVESPLAGDLAAVQASLERAGTRDKVAPPFQEARLRSENGSR